MLADVFVIVRKGKKMADQNNKKGGQQQDVNQLLKVRREKLQNLQDAGKDPFQITKYDVTHHSSDVKEQYNAHESEILAGRVTPNVEGSIDSLSKATIENGTIIKTGDNIEIIFYKIFYKYGCRKRRRWYFICYF